MSTQDRHYSDALSDHTSFPPSFLVPDDAEFAMETVEIEIITEGERAVDDPADATPDRASRPPSPQTPPSEGGTQPTEQPATDASAPTSMASPRSRIDTSSWFDRMEASRKKTTKDGPKQRMSTENMNLNPDPFQREQPGVSTIHVTNIHDNQQKKGNVDEKNNDVNTDPDVAHQAATSDRNFNRSLPMGHLNILMKALNLNTRKSNKPKQAPIP